MKKPKKPKLLKYPKLPKAKASLETMKSYARRLTETDRKNSEKARVYNQKIADIEAAKKLHASLKVRKSKPKAVKLKTA